MNSEEAKGFTFLVVCVWIIILLIYDVIIIWLYGPNASVSVAVHEYSSRFPVFALIVGIGLGHVFWKHMN